jgi:hypothetical protein
MNTNYFLDIKLLEGAQKKRMFGINGFTAPTIDLISIGLVSSDGREYYAISKDFNLKEAWDRFEMEKWKGPWPDDFISNTPSNTKVFSMREKVLYPIFHDMYKEAYPEKYEERYGNFGNFQGWKDHKNTAMMEFQEILLRYGKSNKQIAKEVIEFCRPNSKKAKEVDIVVMEPIDFPKFYSYFSGRSWVAFCWLFTDIPKGFPSYCKQLGESFEKKAQHLVEQVSCVLGKQGLDSLDRALEHLKIREDYPRQTSSQEHSALEQARYFKKLHTFIERP